MLHRLWKPWFVHRPTQIARRAWVGMFPPDRGYRVLRTSWGASLCADPSRTIGRNITTTGLYDIAVSEVLARLVKPGSTVYDVGANIGHMSLLSAVAAGPQGKVHAFEPHPELVEYLRRNVRTDQAPSWKAPVEVHQTALGSQKGVAKLYLPDYFDSNDGVASLVGSGRGVEVLVDTLDSCIGAGKVDVMKVDVEGFEFEVFRGGEKALAEHRIRHILFEEHEYADSRVFRQLRAFGYQIFSIGWTVANLRVMPVERGVAHASFETPNFVATVAAQELYGCCSDKGWRVLRPNLGRAEATN